MSRYRRSGAALRSVEVVSPLLLAVAIDEQRLLDLVQDLVLQVLRRFGLQELQAERVDRPDEHLRHARNVAQRLAGSSDDSLLEFGGRLLGEREGDDIAPGAGSLAGRA